MIINMMIKWSKKISRLSKFDIPAFTENMIYWQEHQSSLNFYQCKCTYMDAEAKVILKGCRGGGNGFSS